MLARCGHYNWQFMIVLKDDSLPTVWTEYSALLELKPGHEHRQSWGERAQHFRWVNDIRGPWLDPPTVKQRMERAFRLRLT